MSLECCHRLRPWRHDFSKVIHNIYIYIYTYIYIYIHIPGALARNAGKDLLHTQSATLVFACLESGANHRPRPCVPVPSRWRPSRSATPQGRHISQIRGSADRLEASPRRGSPEALRSWSHAQARLQQIQGRPRAAHDAHQHDARSCAAHQHDARQHQGLSWRLVRTRVSAAVCEALSRRPEAQAVPRARVPGPKAHHGCKACAKREHESTAECQCDSRAPSSALIIRSSGLRVDHQGATGLGVQVEHGAAREHRCATHDQHLRPCALLPAQPVAPTPSRHARPRGKSISLDRARMQAGSVRLSLPLCPSARTARQQPAPRRQCRQTHACTCCEVQRGTPELPRDLWRR